MDSQIMISIMFKTKQAITGMFLILWLCCVVLLWWTCLLHVQMILILSFPLLHTAPIPTATIIGVKNAYKKENHYLPSFREGCPLKQKKRK